MTKIRNAVAIITGATGGIGAALCLAFAKRGAKLVLVAKDIVKLNALKESLSDYKIEVLVYSADVSSSEAVKVVCQSAVQEFGSVDILVNNAAIGLFQKMADSSPDDICRLWSTNVLGPIYFIQELLPFMRKQGHGHIVNISSVAGRYGIYHQGIYAATKAAIDRISEALAMEERNNGILVTTVAPDRTETDFISHALGPKELAVLPGGNLRKLTSTAVAEGIIRAIERNETIHYSSWRGYIFRYSVAPYRHWLPTW